MANGNPQDETNKQYEQGKQHIRETRIEVSALYDQFTRLGDSINRSIRDAIDNQREFGTLAEEIGDTYRKDIISNIKDLTRNMGDQVDIQMKINKGPKL